MAERPGDPTALGRIASNEPVLRRLADGAQRSTDGVGPWSPDGWVMRTHPDVTEVVEAVAPDHLRMVYGIATLIDAEDRIYAVARGTGYLWVRGDVDDSAVTVDGLDGWVEIRAWGGRLDEIIRESAARTAAAGRPDAGIPDA